MPREAARLPAWRDDSSGPRLRSRRPRCSSTSSSIRVRRPCSCSPRSRSCPLAWLIGEATEHAGEHTGPRIGGLLNASFGNAPEVIIALIAVADNLPDVVRGSMAGSIVSNILLVLGAGLLVGKDNARLDRKSLLGQLGLVFIAVGLLLIPSIPGWHGNPNRHSLALLSIGPAFVLLALYLAVTIDGSRRRPAHEVTDTSGWSLRLSLVVLR